MKHVNIISLRNKTLMFSKKRQGRCFCRLEIQEFTFVNDCISRQKNEEIGVFLQTLISIVVAVTLLIPTSAFAQLPVVGFGNTQSGNLSTVGKPKLSVSLTSSFAAYAPGYTSFGTTIMPTITFPVSDKFSLSTGIGYSSLFMNNDNGSVFNSAPSSYGHVFVSGAYEVNEKISLRGTGYKTFNLSQSAPFINESNSVGYDFSSQGVIVDVEYRVTDNFRINVGFEYREQNNPMYNPNGIQQNNPYFNTMLPFQGVNNHNSLVPF